MSIVTKFIINDKTIDVADSTARTQASTANETATAANTIATQAKQASTTNASDIAALKALPRLEVAYSENTSAITFTNATHSA